MNSGPVTLECKIAKDHFFLQNKIDRIERFPVIVSDLKSHLPIESLFKCDFSYSFAEVDKI